MESQISKVDEYIGKNLKREFSLQDIAEYVGYSAYHFSREYKRITGRTVMEHVREQKIMASASEIAVGRPVLETALDFGFDTHAGFTRAFSEVMGCTPKEYREHSSKLKIMEEIKMDTAKIRVRLVCADDVNDLWENCYSAMTPRQIREDKIAPSIENYKAKRGFMSVAEVDGKAVMTMWVEQLYSSPGFIFDSHYIWQKNEYDSVFETLLSGTVNFAKQINMTALCLYEDAGSPYVGGFIKSGFTKVFAASGLEYYMLSLD
jgi:AraC-like DNA-binding protein